ncbi:DUF397 domain-containing protein [Sphaerisporangium rufum]|uniref:DUF397 domain-containing protein n=1 Tax=Sphaerisporangium rufum TaxID=1381558 RepID=UPI0019504DA8|nr:DUF397 domain-containing protein [Sphaerisporangium rufum]
MNPYGAGWRRSSYSGSSGGQCVEVTMGMPGAVGIRDSKVPGGPVVTVDPHEWLRFLREVAGRCC